MAVHFLKRWVWGLFGVFWGLSTGTALAQEPARPWAIQVAGMWLSPNGEIRLVRGDRKVVTNDVESGVAGELSLKRHYRGAWHGVLRLRRASFTFINRETFTMGNIETFTMGNILESRDEVTYTALLAGMEARWPTSSRWKPFALGYFGIILHNDALDLRSERQLPDDLNTINPEDIQFKLKHAFAVGGGVGLAFELTEALTLTGEIGITLSRLKADLVDQNSRRNNVVDLPLDPWGGGIGLTFHF